MGFRTIAITKRAKLNLTMGFLEVRGEETKRIFLDDIDILLIENQAEMIPYYGSGDSSRKIRKQITWSNEIKTQIWTAIVREKI